MITLSEAFNLLNLNEECLYMRNYKDKWQYDEYFYSEFVKKYFDMQKIHVIRIDRHFTYDEESGKYYTLLVNLSREEIHKARREIENRYY